MINKYIGRIRTVFSWGAENGITQPAALAELRTLRPLTAGEPGTFDHDERECVPIEVVKITLRYTSPTVATMAQIQTLTGMRPSELCRLTVGDIDQSDSDGWVYVMKKHKTARKTGKKCIVFGKAEQVLLAPYFLGKKAESAVFSPRQAMKEHHAERRAERKSKITPSQQERNRQRAENPKQRVGEFYTPAGYGKAIKHAIKAANKAGESIPHWTPYQLRHTAATETSRTLGRDKAQILLTHKTSAMTARYDHSNVDVLKAMAKNRRNPFTKTPAEVQ
jgi:integrase